MISHHVIVKNGERERLHERTIIECIIYTCHKTHITTLVQVMVLVEGIIYKITDYTVLYTTVCERQNERIRSIHVYMYFARPTVMFVI